MPRPGFYNDNEYRAYPFIDTETISVAAFAQLPTPGLPHVFYTTRDTNKKYRWNGAAYFEITLQQAALPTNIILDAGFIMGLDARYDENTHTVWLSEIRKTGSLFEFVFRTNASTATLSFTRHDDSREWANEYSESAVDATNQCADEPIWSGFLVTGSLAPLIPVFNNAAVNGVWTLQSNNYQIEPGLIQNLNKAYLRSISVGNYDRVRVPPCDVTGINDNRAIIANARCMKGDIRFKEGYNCLITQTDRANEISITASKGGGAGETSAELCENGGELPLHPGEQKPVGSKFYSGGPACSEIISTINGVGGSNINIVGGAGVNILIEDGQIVVQKKPNAQINCT